MNKTALALVKKGSAALEFITACAGRVWCGVWMTLALILISPAAGSATVSAQTAVNFTVDTSTSPMTGLWWNQKEPGWGMSLTQQGPVIFVAWYTYDQSGKSMWLVMSSCAVAGDSCTGDIYSVAGGTAPGLPWNDAGKVVAKVGSGTLAFSDNNSASFNYTLNGISGTRNITRQVFATGAVPPSVDYSALWWNAKEPGWGVALTHQYGTIFATLYTYDANGSPVWYVASSCAVSGNGCTGDLYQVTGGSTPTVAWNGANIVTTKIGTVGFDFSDSSNGVMSYVINGVAGSKVIGKQQFYTAPSAIASLADCFAVQALLTTGNSWKIDYESTGSEGVSTYSNTVKVNAAASFKGNNATEVQYDIAILSGAASGSTMKIKSYGKVSDLTSYIYGTVTTLSTPFGGLPAATNSYSPAIQLPLNLALNMSYTQTYSTKVEPLTLPDPTVTQTITFLGAESITVPAGAFSACKVKTESVLTQPMVGASAVISSGTAFDWIVSSGPYQGFLAKSLDQKGNLSVATKLLFLTGK